MSSDEQRASLLGSVIERTPSNSAGFTGSVGLPKTGFPAVHHRSKSQFTRNRESARRNTPPRDATASVAAPSTTHSDEWRDQISLENEQRILNLTEEDREQERQRIFERFGPDVAEILRRARSTRERQRSSVSEEQRPAFIASVEQPKDDASQSAVLPPFAPSLNRKSTPGRPDRRLRFAEISPQDVFVYESTPSPKKLPLSLPAPNAADTATPLGKWSGVIPTDRAKDTDTEQGTAEYIRRRYFPDSPGDDPTLAWTVTPSGSLDSVLRFDLSGQSLSPSLSASLPTHLGLHHHAEGKRAGYTLDDIFLLSRSTVPAQRAAMLRVLARIARQLSKAVRGEVAGICELIGKEEELRARIVAAGIEAMSERGSVGACAIEAVWQGIVGWDEEALFLDGINLELSGDMALNSVPLECFLPEVTILLEQRCLTSNSRLQLLSVLIRMAQENQNFASCIATTPGLISAVIQTFLVTPIPFTDGPFSPEPLAIDLFTQLTSASRTNALVLREAADVALRFLAIPPTSSAYPSPVAMSLAISTCRFYRALASYGLYSHIASTAMAELGRLARCVISDECKCRRLMVAWTDLLESWIVCAIDPHQTTPKHDILWSQITAWRWHQDVTEMSQRLGTTEADWIAWDGVWRVKASWLEGSEINRSLGSSDERNECVENLRNAFQDGKEKSVVVNCLNVFKHTLQALRVEPLARSQLSSLRDISRYATTLASAMRLWLSCLPLTSDYLLSAPPFPLPFSQISDLCAEVVVHPVWSLLLSSPGSSMAHACLYLRPLSNMLCAFLRLSKQHPGISQVFWSAQVFSSITRLLPGDEEFASQLIEEVFVMFNSQWTATHKIQLPPIIWCKEGLSAIETFVKCTIYPEQNTYIGPLSPTPRSILLANTQRLPSVKIWDNIGLPLPRDWTMTPINHLLRSATSDVFKSIPDSWNLSEVEIIRASLTLTIVVREILSRFALKDFIPTPEEVIFGCMKVFMLEHGQPHTDSTEDVFRDEIVEQLMDSILQVYTINETPVMLALSDVPNSLHCKNIEQVAAKFLGDTPFFQYYTEFVSLYDAISFSHTQFARLLLPPTSMRYAIDYRKYLWNDFGHILRTIRTSMDSIISLDPREFFWPYEKDLQMINAYLRSLVKGDLYGFVYLVALHHVSSNIWLHHEEGWEEERASHLLHTITGQCEPNVIQDVLLYHQPRSEGLLHYPECVNLLGDDEKDVRRKLMTSWGFNEQTQCILDAIR